MGHPDSGGSDFDIDLESGGTTSDEEGIIVQDLSSENGKKVLRRTWSGIAGLNRSARVGNGLDSFDEVLNSGQVSVENMEILSEKLGEEMVDSLEKQRNSNSKKPSKPPRPPKGPLLDAADMKYVKEFSELAKLKRKRIERMKRLKKKKSEKKASSSSTNVIAMVVTVLFCLVIIFQGLLGSHV